ncbi:WhiB family transcriptional regulator [Micrococcaceae bacterium RIT802]|nr:WhiB family transcriptional regulator [Micrococcaceae bacterium RIT 802]
MLTRTRARRLTKSPLRADGVVDWRELAACKGLAEKGFDPWFPVSPSEVDAWTVASKVCATCPVIESCLESAMSREKGRSGLQRHGMYGGLKPEERFALHRRRLRLEREAKKVS